MADRIGGLPMLKIATVSIIVFGFAFKPLFGTHNTATMLAFLILGFGLTGLSYGPLGSALATLFPTPVRYTGTSLTFNVAGILGASIAAPIANWLASRYGLAFVGYYLSVSGLITLIALLLIKGEKNMIRNNLAVVAAFLFTILSAANHPAPAADRFDAAVAHPGRPAADPARDAKDHPAEILRLTGINSGMQVADVLAGDGYYSELLSYIVGAKGQVLLINNAAFDHWSEPDLQNRVKDNRLPNVRASDRRS